MHPLILIKILKGVGDRLQFFLQTIMKAPSNKSKSGNGQSSYASKPKKSSDSKKSSELKHDLKQRVGKDGVVKKSKKRAQRIPTDDGMR